jgi:hypothetical protein
MAKLRGVLNENDKQQFLEKLLNDHVQSRKNKVYETLFKYRLYEMCPYCNTKHIFPEAGNGSFRKKIVLKAGSKSVAREFLVAPCEKTGRYVFFFADVIQEGDILTGEDYYLEIHSMTDEEIRQMIDWKETQMDDELRKALRIKTFSLPGSNNSNI